MRKTDPSKVQEQRERIIKGALKCFARKGVSGTSTDDICRAAKVSSGTLYYYFKSRDGLIHDLIVHAHATRDELLSRVKDAPNLLDAVIEAQFAAAGAIKAQGMPMDVFMELVAFAHRNVASKEAFQEAAARAMSMLTEAVKAHQQAGKLSADIDAGGLARVLGSSASGMSLMEILDRDFTIERYREPLAALLYPDVKASG